MAKFVNADTRRAIRAAVANNNRVMRWGRVSCYTLAYDVLEAQGIVVEPRDVDPAHALDADTLGEAFARIAKHSASIADYVEAGLDRIPELVRVDSPYEWEAGMVGVPPREGMIRVGFRSVAVAEQSPVLGVVDDRGVPMVMTLDRGLAPINKLWPRWKQRLAHV